jgi:hypothetical protein
MSKKREDIIILIAVMLALIGCAIFFIYVDYNSPPKKVERDVKAYLAQHHPDSDYEISSISFDDKYKNYIVTMSSPSSADSQFSMTYDAKGYYKENSYEYRVINKANTANRLSDAYAAAVHGALNAIPNYTDFARGQLLWSHPDGSHPDPRYIASEELQLDGEYDLSELGAQAGYIWFRVEVDYANGATVENLAQILLYVRKTLDEAGLPFYKIGCRLNYWDRENSKELELANFLYDDIYEEGLEARLTKALKK